MYESSVLIASLCVMLVIIQSHFVDLVVERAQQVSVCRILTLFVLNYS